MSPYLKVFLCSSTLFFLLAFHAQGQTWQGVHDPDAYADQVKGTVKLSDPNSVSQALQRFDQLDLITGVCRRNLLLSNGNSPSFGPGWVTLGYSFNSEERVWSEHMSEAKKSVFGGGTAPTERDVALYAVAVFAVALSANESIDSSIDELISKALINTSLSLTGPELSQLKLSAEAKGLTVGMNIKKEVLPPDTRRWFDSELGINITTRDFRPFLNRPKVVRGNGYRGLDIYSERAAFYRRTLFNYYSHQDAKYKKAVESGLGCSASTACCMVGFAL